MNQNQIVSLLDRTFNAAFDVETYAGFLKELLNEPRIHIQPKTRDVPGQFREYVAQLTKVGEYVDPEQESIELLAVKVNRHSSVERARTMQRNFVANWLNKRETFTAAIVAFYDDEEADWRFSFVKLEYQLAEDEEGVLKTEKVLTSAKRYSFLVGPTEPNHTCRKQFQDLLEESDRNPLISQIEEAFGIERVTNEFFKRYREHFLQIKESLDRIIKRDGSIRDEFVRVSSEQDLDGYVVEFSKKLLGQIVFLYFLQKKSWLGIERDENGKW